MNIPLFQADLYKLYRPAYPPQIFDDILSRLKAERPISVLDLGCGTGLSIEALLRDAPPFGLKVPGDMRIIGIDQDAQMAKHIDLPGVQFQDCSADKIPFSNSTFNLIFSGSAYHWFKSKETFEEIRRLLTSSGYFYAFEYQFPKAIQNKALNDFIKNEFNRNWKAPSQSPRGRFRDLFLEFQNSPDFKKVDIPKIKMIRKMSAGEFFGHLLSQSRYLHFDSQKGDTDRAQYRESLLKEIMRLYDEEGFLDFDFYFDQILFHKMS